jgi:hypothetical protein
MGSECFGMRPSPDDLPRIRRQIQGAKKVTNQRLVSPARANHPVDSLGGRGVLHVEAKGRPNFSNTAWATRSCPMGLRCNRSWARKRRSLRSSSSFASAIIAPTSAPTERSLSLNNRKRAAHTSAVLPFAPVRSKTVKSTTVASEAAIFRTVSAYSGNTNSGLYFGLKTSFAPAWNEIRVSGPLTKERASGTWSATT